MKDDFMIRVRKSAMPTNTETRPTMQNAHPRLTAINRRPRITKTYLECIPLIDSVLLHRIIVTPSAKLYPILGSEKTPQQADAQAEQSK